MKQAEKEANDLNDDQARFDKGLVPQSTRGGITRPHHLVRRGLDELSKKKKPRHSDQFDDPFDQKIYDSMKPLLTAAIRSLNGMSSPDLLRFLMRSLRENYQFTLKQIKAMKPYLIRFVQDVDVGWVSAEDIASTPDYAGGLAWLAGLFRDEIQIGLGGSDSEPNEETEQKSKRLFYRGRTKQDNGDCMGAIADFDKAIEIDPRHARYYFRRGGAKESNGDLGGAISDYTKAIEIHPQYAFAYHSRAGAKWIISDLEGALKDYDEAIEILPRYPGFYNNRGRAKQANGDLHGAIADYKTAIEIDPEGIDAVYHADVAIAYALRGLAYLSQARDREAQEDFTRCIDIDGPLEAWVRERINPIREGASASYSGPRPVQESAVEKAWTRVGELAGEMGAGTVTDLDEIIAKLSDDLAIIKHNSRSLDEETDG
jgi:tetratricopeptide (TPR) repeat protein